MARATQLGEDYRGEQGAIGYLLRQTIHDELFQRFGSPSGEFTLGAVARCAVARVATERL